MAGNSVELSNGRRWPTKTAAENHFRALRDRSALNTPITDADDHDDLLALLERYDLTIYDEPSKIGIGVRHFETRVNLTHGKKTIGFWVIRSDWSETDFSFIRAVSARPTLETQRFSDACRTAVDEDVLEAKIRFFSEHADQDGRILCPITGSRISKSEARADYSLTPFDSIVRSFRDDRGWDISTASGKITPPADAQLSAIFIDPALSKDFRLFHHSIAKIRMVAKSTTPTQIRNRGDHVTSDLLLFY